MEQQAASAAVSFQVTLFLSILRETWAAGLLTSLVAVDCHGLLVKEGKCSDEQRQSQGETSALPHSPCLYFTLLGQLDDLKITFFMWFQLQTLI